VTVAVTDGNLEVMEKWKQASEGRILPALPFDPESGVRGGLARKKINLDHARMELQDLREIQAERPHRFQRCVDNDFLVGPERWLQILPPNLERWGVTCIWSGADLSTGSVNNRHDANDSTAIKTSRLPDSSAASPAPVIALAVLFIVCRQQAATKFGHLLGGL
jgi:hypothetical protein